MTDRDFFEQTDFSFEITGNGDEIEIRPYIDIESGRARTLIASFLVDSLEMIESARIPLSAGKNHVPFQQTVRIVKPLLWQPRGEGVPSCYTFSVIFHQHGEPVHQIDRRTGIRFIETSPRRKSVRINGREVRLVSRKTEAGNFEGNTVCLEDTDPGLKDKLEDCGRQGLIAVLKLTGALRPEQVAALPDVCLLAAEAGSPAGRLFRRSRHPQLAPLLTAEELDLLLNE